MFKLECQLLNAFQVRIHRGKTALFALCPLNPHHQELTEFLSRPLKLLMVSKQGSERYEARPDPEYVNHTRVQNSISV